MVLRPRIIRYAVPRLVAYLHMSVLKYVLVRAISFYFFIRTLLLPYFWFKASFLFGLSQGTYSFIDRSRCTVLVVDIGAKFRFDFRVGA